MKRLGPDILLFAIILVCPWWVSILFALFFLYYLKTFNEIIIFGMIIDIVYGKFSPGFHLFNFKYTILTLILLLTSFAIKKRLKFYAK